MSWMKPGSCKCCDNPPLPNRTRCLDCSEKDKIRTRAYVENKKRQGLCIQWGCNNKARDNRVLCEVCAKNKKRSREQIAADVAKNGKRYKTDENYRKRNITYTREWQRGLLAKIFKKYGDRCNSPYCGWINIDGSKGCTDIRCLQIDHVNGGGVKEVKALSYTVRLKMYLEDITGKYQLLCANCNWIKRSVCNENKKGKQ